MSPKIPEKKQKKTEKNRKKQKKTEKKTKIPEKYQKKTTQSFLCQVVGFRLLTQ